MKTVSQKQVQIVTHKSQDRNDRGSNCDVHQFRCTGLCVDGAFAAVRAMFGSGTDEGMIIIEEAFVEKAVAAPGEPNWNLVVTGSVMV